MRGRLFIVGTPIGNLDDFSNRAIETLREVDIIYCEDTRVSAKLFNHYEISKPLRIYETHREKRVSEDIINCLNEGKDIALVSDAGMPGISDPGAEVIKSAIKEDFEISVVSGANAGLMALILSGFNTGKFFFEGFLPAKGSARIRRLKEVLQIPHTVILYEAPHRMPYLLNDIKELAPERRLSLSRELTKFYEETIRGTASELKAYFKDIYKGEMVLVIEGYERESVADDDIKKLLIEKIKEGYSNKDAIREIMQITGRNKNDIYKISLEIEDD